MIDHCALSRPKKRILIIDDEDGFSNLLRMNLERTGEFDVCCESDPRRALEAAHFFHPDLVFLDIVMPELDGGEVAARFRRDPKLESTPVVFLTALIDSRESGRGIFGKAGGQQMIGKPLNMETVCDCLERNLYGKASSPASSGKESSWEDISRCDQRMSSREEKGSLLNRK